MIQKIKKNFEKDIPTLTYQLAEMNISIVCKISSSPSFLKKKM